MGTFVSALDRVPGLAGFLQQRQMARGEDAAALQQAAALQGMLAKAKAQEQEAEFRKGLAALDPNDQGALAALAAKYASPETVLKTQQSSLDRQATAESTRATREATLAQQAHAAELMHQYRLSQAKTQQDRDAETARHNKALEAIQTQLVEIRGDAAKQKNLPKPKVGYRWNEAGTEQEPIPGGPVARQRELDSANAKRSVDLTVQNLDRLDTAMAELDADPGLPRITGSVAGRTPNITNAATGAQAKLDSIKSQIFVSALQSMRDASKTGGAVGQVTEREGDKLENSIAALSQAQGTADFKVQLAKARAQLKASKAIIQRAYSEQYGEGGGAVTAPPAPASGPAEGQTATNQSTGQKIIFKGGQWQPM